MLEHDDTFQVLTERQQALARKMAEGNTSVEQLLKSLSDQTIAHVTQQHVLTRDYVGALETKLTRVVESQVQQAEFDRFMHSLHFPEINLRQETIASAHEKTFQWILDEHQSPEAERHSFSDWLRNDEQLYWILGKPGSGKSTLMKFIVQNTKIQEVLNSTGEATTFLTFFFLENGVELQRSQVGLLRSLVYQILESMAPESRHRTWHGVLRPTIPPLPTIWTSERLLHLLGLLVGSITQPLCIFLDGLDEFQGEPDRVEPITALYDIFKGHRQFKLCIASRDEPELQPLFESCPSMKMQDLTEVDIQQYVKDKLLSSPFTENISRSSSCKPEDLVRQVVLKADGVFLWVTLTVQSLLRGIRNEDSWEDLQQRLKQVPSGIFDLYTHMWKRMEIDRPIYAKEATAYFQLLHLHQISSLADMAIVVDDSLQDKFSEPAATWNAVHFRAKVDYNKTEKRITACCAGLLVVEHIHIDHTDKRYRSKLEQSNLNLTPDDVMELVDRHHRLHWSYVTFVHRSFSEFLKTPRGHELLQAGPHAIADLRQRRLRAILISIFLFSVQGTDTDPFAMTYAFRNGNVLRAQSQAATRVFFDLETVFEKLLGWRIWDLRLMPRRFLGFDGEVDYAKTFITFCHPGYTRLKLERKNLAPNPEYLTELLRLWVGGHLTMLESDVHSDTAPGNAQLLLHLGADSNDSVGHIMKLSAIFDMTLWFHMLVRILGYYNSMTDLLPILLQTGADVNASVTCYSEAPAITDELGYKSVHFLSQSFILHKWHILDLVLESDLSAEELMGVLQNLEQQGAKCAKKRLLWFQPPDVWRVLKPSAEDSMIFTANRPRYIWSDLVRQGPCVEQLCFVYASPGETLEMGLDRKLEKDLEYFDTFSNGIEAFEAAGWSREERLKTPCLKKFCDGLL